MVIEKPSGISSVPYERKETGTALDLDPRRLAPRRQARHGDAALHRPPDRQGHLRPARLRQDPAGRARRCTRSSSATPPPAPTWPSPKGTWPPPRIESQLVADRGDGIRGSTRHADQGQLAITYVEPLRRYEAPRDTRKGSRTLRDHAERARLVHAGNRRRGRADWRDRRYTLPRAPRDRTNPSDSHPPLRARPPAGRRDRLHPRPPARRAGAAARRRASCCTPGCWGFRTR